MNFKNRGIRGALVAVTVALAVVSVPAGGGAADAKAPTSKAILDHAILNKAILDKAILDKADPPRGVPALPAHPSVVSGPPAHARRGL